MKISGKTCLITGASSGLGLALSKKITGMGAHAILLCRNKEKGENAVHEIKKEIPDASVDLMICDLSSIISIKNFIEQFKSKYTNLDIFYNNAAVMKRQRTLTIDGIELMFQVNYLAPFILIKSFLELLRNSPPSIIINNGRPADKLRLDWDDLQFSKNYHMYNSFFKTKLCLLFATLELSRRYKNNNISVAMIDPGPFKSDLVREVPIMGWFKNLFSAPVNRACDNILYHITSDEAQNKNGKVFKEKQEKKLTPYWSDTGNWERMWSVTESLIEKYNI